LKDGIGFLMGGELIDLGWLGLGWSETMGGMVAGSVGEMLLVELFEVISAVEVGSAETVERD
jgi:alkylation response protein AidB-like acyl-CoA dehydrogenase